MRRLIKILAVLLLSAQAASAYAQDRLIPFQARLSDGQGTPSNGSYALQFAIYDAPTGGAPIGGWSEIHSSVSVVNGVVNVILGSLVNLDDPNGDGDLSDAVTFDSGQQRFVGISVNSGTEMVPRHQLIPSFHARSADTATIVVANAIDSSMIQVDAIDASHITDGSIGPADLQSTPFLNASNIVDAAINTAKLADDAVGSSKIVDGSISLNDISNAVIEALMPTGTVLAYAGATAPQGFLECDGTPIPRADNPDLFAAINTLHGDGTFVPGASQPTYAVGTRFNLPDYRGRFLRGVDETADRDPDKNNRLASMPGGSLGNTVGSVQADAFQEHTHTILGKNHGAHNIITSWGGAQADRTGETEPAGSSTETRPKNANVMYIIRCGRADACTGGL